MYPYEFTNIHAFTQRVALDMVRYGFLFYVTGRVPEGRDPVEVDTKILSRYDIAVSKYTRARRKAKGRANIHYARHQDFFVMLASTGGEHEWFLEEEWKDERAMRTKGRKIRYVPRQPIVHGGYSIGYKECSGTGKGHVSVRIHPDDYRAIKSYFLDLATHRSVESLSREFARFPFEPYALVRNQRWNILRAVNSKRERAGLEPLPADGRTLRKKRRVFRYLEDEVVESPELLEAA